ncbi:clavesin-2-like [Epargyreus clarus]|uniref:clavesin-2-like n=1 Tax=Epargyreus clarus TaxID=520877 RepID=UPI003C2D71F1
MVAPVNGFPVEKEYEKNPDISPEDIRKLREWLSTQPHLPVEHLTDQDLMITFHCCEKSPEVAKQVLDLHFTLRTLFTAFFKDRAVDQKVKDVMENVLITALPTPTTRGYKAIYARLLNYDPRNFHFANVIRTFMMLFDLVQYKEGTWPGLVVIIDMDQAVIGHLAKLDLMTVRQVLYFVQECMLIRLKEVHFLNAPSFMDKLMMMLRPFMKKELLDIIHIHQIGSDTLEKFVPKKALPKESGGEEKDWISLRNESLQLLEDNPEYFKRENLRRVNEALRVGGKPANIENLFGIQGSFKKLDID